MPLWRGSASGSVFTSSAKQVPVDAVGDPGLGAVDDVVIAVAPRGACGSPAGRCRQSGSVSADAAAQLAGREARQVVALLLLGAVALRRTRP